MATSIEKKEFSFGGCNYETTSPKRETFSPTTKRLNVNSLRPEFFSHYNPIRVKAALQTEQRVADELRGLGHLVHVESVHG